MTQVTIERELLERALNAFETDDWEKKMQAAIDLRAALQAAPSQPVNQVLVDALDQITAVYIDMRNFLAEKYPNDGWSVGTMTIDGALAALAQAQAQPAQGLTDGERLDFVMKNDAFLHRTKTDTETICYQTWQQDEDENYVVLSGFDAFYPSGRAAIDAAIQKGQQS